MKQLKINSGLTEDFLENQIKKGLEGVESLNGCIIAYEPIWAIGTGETANKDQIFQTHNFINSVLKNYSQNQIIVIYFMVDL